MKTHLSIIILFVISYSLPAQDEFSGWWESKTSKYVTIIHVGEYGVSSVINYNPFNENILEERIIKRNVFWKQKAYSRNLCFQELNSIFNKDSLVKVSSAPAR